MYTIEELRKKINSTDRGFRIPVGEYEISVMYGKHSYCSPRVRKCNSELSAVEVAIFKNGDWVLPADLIAIGLEVMAKKFEGHSGFTSVAPYLSLDEVCMIVNSLPIKPVEKVILERVKHKCRRCGSFDDYVEEGGLCYKCC